MQKNCDRSTSATFKHDPCKLDWDRFGLGWIGLNLKGKVVPSRNDTQLELRKKFPVRS